MPLPRIPRALPIVCVLALLLAYLAAAPLAGRRDGDFVHLWIGGKLVTTGQGSTLYDVGAQKALLAANFGGSIPDTLWMERFDALGIFFYPPPTALVYSLLGAFPLHQAATAQALVSVLLALLCALMLDRLSGLSWWSALALLLLFPSLFYTYAIGQNGVVTLLILLLSALMLEKKRELAAGLYLGLLFYKPSWFVAVCWIPLALRSRRMVAGFITGALGLALLGLPFFGLSPYLDYLELAPRLMALDQQAGYPLHLQHNLLSIGRRWLGTGKTADLVGWALAGGMLTLSVLRLRGMTRLDAFALCLLVASLVNPHVHHYDLLPPMLALAILLGAGESLLPFGLLLCHHLAFPLMAVFDLDTWLPLPTFAVLAIWLYFYSYRVRHAAPDRCASNAEHGRETCVPRVERT